MADAGTADAGTVDAGTVDAGTADAGTPGTPIPLEAFVDTLITESCANVDACAVNGVATFHDAAACEAAAVRASLEWLVELVQGGGATYDPAAARACLDAVLSRCDLGSPPSFAEAFNSFRVEACGAVFHGSRPDGAGCSQRAQCASGICLGGVANACTGRCGQPVGLGAGCGGSIPCVAGLTCYGTCIEPTPPAEPKQPGEPCISHDECRSDSFCDLEFGSGFCTLRGALGTACRYRSPIPCQPGLVCSAVGSGSGTCVAMPRIGEECVAGPTGGGGFCLDGAACVPEGSVGRCRARVGAGATCVNTDQCNAQDLTCATADHRCTPRQALGAACAPTEGLVCALGLSCLAGKCANGVGLGAECDGRGCAPGLVCSPRTETCIEETPPERPCSHGLCTPGSVCVGSPRTTGHCEVCD